MVKKVTEYTKEELEEKIMNIKAKQARTAETLRKYEEELECRKQNVTLGVPSKLKTYMYYFLNSKNEVAYPSTIDNKWDALDRHSACNVFDTYKSAEKHAEMLLAWRKALVANSKGEQIDITVLLPLLPKGYVAMDAFGLWRWYYEKPDRDSGEWKDNSVIPSERLSAFNLKRADDWKTSLMECGL